MEKAKKREEILKNQIRSLQQQNNILLNECKNNNIDITKINLNVNNNNKGHNTNNNTTALVTMVPQLNASDNAKQLEVLQNKLETTNDEKIKLTESISKKLEELEDANQELNECHAHIQEMHEQTSELQKRYEELHSAKSHLDKLFQSLNSGNDANQNRFATEKLQWNEDKIQFLDELRTKDNKVDELQTIQEEMENTINDLRKQTQIKSINSNDIKKEPKSELVNMPISDGNNNKVIYILFIYLIIFK